MVALAHTGFVNQPKVDSHWHQCADQPNSQHQGYGKGLYHLLPLNTTVAARDTPESAALSACSLCVRGVFSCFIGWPHLAVNYWFPLVLSLTLENRVKNCNGILGFFLLHVATGSVSAPSGVAVGQYAKHAVV